MTRPGLTRAEGLQTTSQLTHLVRRQCCASVGRLWTTRSLLFRAGVVFHFSRPLIRLIDTTDLAAIIPIDTHRNGAFEVSLDMDTHLLTHSPSPQRSWKSLDESDISKNCRTQNTPSVPLISPRLHSRHRRLNVEGCLRC